jgi:SAM-dependent methyltransferase
MSRRSCPFCLGKPTSRAFGGRDGVWIRCTNCRSVFRDVAADKFGQLHDHAIDSVDGLDATVAACGTEPDTSLWHELALPGTSVLELGPGGGHLLAAAHEAGCTVAAVEPNEYDRTFIRDTWGIHSLYPDIAAVPTGRSFDVVVAKNVLEHVYDITGFLRSVRGVLAQNGVLFVSTVNAISLEAVVLRNWWSMCKVHDHVSFPSPRGMVLAARAAGLQPERIWSSELPFEFPVSALVAARDWTRARRGLPGSAPHPSASLAPGGKTVSKAQLAHFYAVSGSFDPTSRLLGALGRAATVKARLRLRVSNPKVT